MVRWFIWHTLADCRDCNRAGLLCPAAESIIVLSSSLYEVICILIGEGKQLLIFY